MLRIRSHDDFRDLLWFVSQNAGVSYSAEPLLEAEMRQSIGDALQGMREAVQTLYPGTENSEHRRLLATCLQSASDAYRVCEIQDVVRALQKVQQLLQLKPPTA